MDSSIPTQTFILDDSILSLTTRSIAKRDVNLIFKSSTLRILNIKGTNARGLDVSQCPCLKHLTCPRNKLSTILLNDGISTVNCAFNNLTEIKLPNSLLAIMCANNKITEIKPNESLLQLLCSNNNLTKLELNTKLGLLKCAHNKIETIKVNPDLIIMSCEYNLLNTLILNDKMFELNCSHNKLSELKINKGLQRLICTNNNITSLALNSLLRVRQLYDLVDTNVKLIPYRIPHFSRHPNSEEDCCAICFESNNLVLTKCNHAFHLDCILLLRNTKCPCCRAVVQQLQLV